MSKKLYRVIFLSVFVVLVFSGWEVYKAFEKEKDVGQYEEYAKKIDREFYVDMLQSLYGEEGKVLVKDEDIGEE